MEGPDSSPATRVRHDSNSSAARQLHTCSQGGRQRKLFFSCPHPGTDLASAVILIMGTCDYNGFFTLRRMLFSQPFDCVNMR